MQNPRMPKQIPTSTTEGKRKRGRSCKRRRHENDEDLNIMEIKITARQWSETTGNGGRF